MASVVGQNPKFRDINFNLKKTPVIHPTVFVAPNASLIGNINIGKDSSIWYGCILRGDNNYIQIGHE